MTSLRRSTRASKAPVRYEPQEMPEDDNDSGVGDDMMEQDGEDVKSIDSNESEGSLRDFIAADDDVQYESDPDDPDWEETSMDEFTSDEDDAQSNLST